MSDTVSMCVYGITVGWYWSRVHTTKEQSRKHKAETNAIL